MLHLHPRLNFWSAKEVQNYFCDIQSEGERKIFDYSMEISDKNNDKVLATVAKASGKRSYPNSDSCNSSVVAGSFDDFSNNVHHDSNHNP